jgi:hypothetical protein
MKTVELDKLLFLGPGMERVPNILGYDEDTNVIFVWMHAGVFTIQPESMEFNSPFLKAPQTM